MTRPERHRAKPRPGPAILGGLFSWLLILPIGAGDERPDVGPLPGLWQQIEHPLPDGRSMAVDHLILTRDVHKFTFESGRLSFLTPVEGRTLGAVCCSWERGVTG